MLKSYNTFLIFISLLILSIIGFINPSFGYNIEKRLSYSGITIPNSVVKIKLKSQTLTTWSKNDGTFTFSSFIENEIPNKINIEVNNFKNENIKDEVFVDIPEKYNVNTTNHLKIISASICDGINISKTNPNIDVVLEIIDGKEKKYVLDNNQFSFQENFEVPLIFNTRTVVNINSMFKGKIQNQSIVLENNNRCD